MLVEPTHKPQVAVESSLQRLRSRFPIHYLLGGFLVLAGVGNILGGWWFLVQSSREASLREHQMTPPGSIAGVSVVASSSAELIDSTSSTSSTVSDPNAIWIDVSGAVKTPGIYPLSSNSRLSDALQAAGGLASKADANWVNRELNLAQKLADGDKFYIYSKGEAPTIPPPSTDSSSNALASDTVSINKASLKELDALPGIGEKRAQDIIDGRPYTALTDLVDQEVLTQSLFDDLKNTLAL